MNKEYWNSLDQLVKANGFEVERPKDSVHPKYPNYIYPLDSGFIPGTSSDDGAEIDAWRAGDRTNVKEYKKLMDKVDELTAKVLSLRGSGLDAGAAAAAAAASIPRQ